MKIYDSFLFFNELDLLDIRLNLLNDYIDKFVLVESTVTFSGKSKKLYFNDNKNYFSNYLHKIIHIIVDDTPDNFINLELLNNPNNTKDKIKNKIFNYINQSSGWNKNENQWGREMYQRESMFNGLIDCNDEDAIIVSDLDEIPNPEEINNKTNGVYDFRQKMFYYNLNTLKEENWSGPKILPYKTLIKSSINDVRQNKITTNIVNNGGWHLSFMGGENRIIEKIEAYAHQEFNNQYIKNNISKNLQNSQDLFMRYGDYSFKEIDIYREFPEKLIYYIKNKYPYLIKK